MSANKDFLDHIDEFKTDAHEHLRFAILAQDEVTYGFDQDCNIQYCSNNNIPCYDRKGPGGTIVHARGSLALNYIYSHNRFPQFLGREFIHDLCVYFQNRGLDAWVDSNDILIENYKVASCAEINLPPSYRWCNAVILIATTQNLELVKQVCLKPMKKVPKALNDWGVSTEEMVRFVLDWFTSKNINIDYPSQ